VGRMISGGKGPLRIKIYAKNGHISRSRNCYSRRTFESESSEFESKILFRVGTHGMTEHIVIESVDYFE